MDAFAVSRPRSVKDALMAFYKKQEEKGGSRHRPATHNVVSL